MSQWLKTLTASLCVLTILMHLVPNGKFAKYVRFYAGLLFFLIAAGPVLQLFAGEGELERLLQLEFLREEYNDLENSIEGMEDLRNDHIEAAYRQELRRQIDQLAETYGLQAADTRIAFDPSDNYVINGVTLTLSPGSVYSSEAVEGLRQELSGVYGLGLNSIVIDQE